MALDSKDKRPVGITMAEAYSKISQWYKNNLDLILNKGDDYSRHSVELIKHLLPSDKINDLEIKAIFGEVIFGYLEWAYHKDDGEYKMAAYALSALDTAKSKWYLEEKEKKQLKRSHLWPYLFINRK